MTAPDLDRLAAGKYLSLTTFRRDGTPVATPVWLAREGDLLFVITSASSGKAKRLRNRSDVLLAPCDARGRVEGAAVPGTARLLDQAGTGVVMSRIQARYGLMGRLIVLAQRIRHPRTPPDQVGLEITLAAAPPGGTGA